MVATNTQRRKIAPPDAPGSPFLDLRPVGAKSLITNTKDISRFGFAAIAMSRLTPGTICWLTFPDTLALEAEVVWWEGGVVGCAFKQMLEPDFLKALTEHLI